MCSDEESKVLFECEGLPVYAGDVLHVAPEYHSRAGVSVTAYCEAFHGEAMCRSHNAAVPILPIAALSWLPHPDTRDLETLRRQLPQGDHVTDRDLLMWRLGRVIGLVESGRPTQAQWVGLQVEEMPPQADNDGNGGGGGPALA